MSLILQTLTSSIIIANKNYLICGLPDQIHNHVEQLETLHQLQLKTIF